MRFSMPKHMLILLIYFGSVCFLSGTGAAENIPLPASLKEKLLNAQTLIDIADAFIDIPYRKDGTLDEFGQYTSIAPPRQTFGTPGLNCSGFVLSLSRLLLSRNIPIDTVTRDRLSDSGKNSPMGWDWDFGFDLIFNIAQFGRGEPEIIDSNTVPKSKLSGVTARGFDIADANAWKQPLSLLSPSKIYLASVSREDAKGRIKHHHVAVILRSQKKQIFLYHTIPAYGVHRLEISTPSGLSRFIAEMTPKKTRERILIVGVEPE